jgi:hypothetical protein
VAKPTPQRPDFVGGQYPLSTCAFVGLDGPGDGVGFGQPLLDCPGEEGRERSPGTITRYRSRLGFDLGQQRSHLSPINVRKAKGMEGGCVVVEVPGSLDVAPRLQRGLLAHKVALNLNPKAFGGKWLGEWINSACDSAEKLASLSSGGVGG